MKFLFVSDINEVYRSLVMPFPLGITQGCFHATGSFVVFSVPSSSFAVTPDCEEKIWVFGTPGKFEIRWVLAVIMARSKELLGK